MENFKTKLECSICPTRIWERNGIKLQRTADYNEVTVKLSDDSKMIVGVCGEHKKPKFKDLKTITDKVQQGWNEEVILGVGNADWVRNKGSNLFVKGLA